MRCDGHGGPENLNCSCYTAKHSLIFASVIGIITRCRRMCFTGMLVKINKPDDC
ncbi:hypothetical protein ACLK1T_17655 [Escherichia coli]